jgi:hypothetical protein
MALLVKDLIHFEEVEEVIKIRREERAKEYVEKYVISDSLRRNLVLMLDMLAGATHKSFNVVGNYGTGKSHFLAFVAALLEHPDYRTLVADPAVAAAAQKVERHYRVVKFELPAAREVPLRRIFFDQVRKQLSDRYGVTVRDVHLETDYDNKQNILGILADIKAQDPEAGLVVIVDEISDFLKQKDREGMAYDIALLRELGEISQDSDFLYVGAMQEHVFTNPKYLEQAESIARVNQRFVTVTITKEDVAQVLTQRVVRKEPDQRKQLAGLLAEHRTYFPNLADQTDRYMDLFPVHPYVIDVFERLPYFENRGIIGFTVDNVKPILGQPAPVFVTYDKVWDLINKTHEVRNQPGVEQVVRVVETLLGKANLLDSRFREDAQRLVKALAVLRLLGGDKTLGATSQELADTLFITPSRKVVVDPNMARDHIERVMKNLRDVTVGQYIQYAQGRYSLDLKKTEDYDAEIDRKARASVIDHEDEIERAFREWAVGELGLASLTSHIPGKGVYTDTAPWPSRKAFRPGLLVIGRADDAPTLVSGDYRFVLQGPVPGKSLSRQDEVVLGLEYKDELISLLIRARAAQMLSQEKVYPKVTAKLAADALAEFQTKYLAALYESGSASYRGHKTPVKQLPARRPLNTLADIVDLVKGELLDGFFAERYPSYPLLRTQVTAANLESEMARTLQSLDSMATKQIDQNSRGYLESFGAMADGHFTASASAACQLILKRIDENDATGKLTPVDDLAREMVQAPWGLPKPMVQMLLGALLFNGYLVFVRQGGSRLHAADIGPFIKNGLNAMADIVYVERDKDINVEAIAGLFEVLGLHAGYIRDKESRTEAVKELRLKGGSLKDALQTLRSGLGDALAQSASTANVPWQAIQDLLNGLAWLDKPSASFAEASQVSHLAKLDPTPEYRATLKARLADLETLRSFLDDWAAGGLAAGVRRMQESVAVLPKLEGLVTLGDGATIADLRRRASESEAIYSDPKQLLRADQRRPLRGKLEQFRPKYDQLYFGLHRRLVGEGAAWRDLAAVRKSERFTALASLKTLPFISPAEFNLLALEIQRLEARRCDQFTAPVLDSFVSCPYCRFEDDVQGLGDLGGRVGQIEAKLEACWQAWQSRVLGELPALAPRLPLLSPEHQRLIEEVQAAGCLPDALPDELLAALQELASELQAVELDPADLGRALLARGGVLTMDELRAEVDNYLNGLAKGHDRGLLRIKVVLGPQA